MRVRLLLPVLLVLAGPALALDEPVTWRDPDSGCAYLLTRGGGIAPKYRRNGAPDCPDASRAAAGVLSDQTVQQMGQGLETLKREMEGLAERLRRP